ncbi:MAG: HU family DNA-binding protein [Spirochaetales bacterium]|nr:HU family DNA-binding protein [Spirochaetales bacterium]
MTKQELIKELAARSEITQKDAREVLEAILEEIVLILEEGDHYNQPGFGTFRSEIKNERISYNPSLKKRMRLPVSRKATFRPSEKLKRRINE